MNNIPLRPLAAGLAAALVLAACGGGGGGGGSNTSSNNGGTSTGGTASYATVLSQLNTTAGMTSPAVAEVFDSAYLDSGMTRNQVVDALNDEAAAFSGNADHSLFPQVTLDGVTLSACDASNVCTLTGTLHNNDAEDTSVQVTTKVVSTGNGNYRVLGDQLPG